jgi:hypothetical protein
MTVRGLVADIVNMVDPVVRTGRIAEEGYAIFYVFDGKGEVCCCVSGLEYFTYGDLCYQMPNVEVAIADSEQEAIALFQARFQGGLSNAASCSNCSL